MRAFGILFCVVIAALCFMGAMGMDTSVRVGDGKRVHNIGLMRYQENAILLAVGLLIAGGIFLVGGRKSPPPVAETNSQTVSDQ